MTEALFPLALLGALLGLDTVSFPQAMLSRPLVAATLGGAMAGSPMDGLLIGAALELIALETLPFGASRYPEWGSASMVGGALFASAHTQPAGSSALAIIAALIVFAPLTEASLALWSLDARTSRAVAVAVATSVAAGAAWKLFHGSTPAKWTFVAGLGAGLTMMATR